MKERNTLNQREQFTIFLWFTFVAIVYIAIPLFLYISLAVSGIVLIAAIYSYYSSSAQSL